MGERWSRDHVLALAPDLWSQKAAAGVARPGKWSGAGWQAAHGALWGECAGSGAKPYRACVDLHEPAYRCGCPSRKFPCKHSLALMLLWSEGVVPEEDEPPDWASEWLAQRRERKPARKSGQADPEAARRRAAQRDERVAGGMAELDRWLADRLRRGLAGLPQEGYRVWDDLARRMIDAQAPGVAGSLAGLAGLPTSRKDWPERVLEELSLLHLLVTAHRRMGELPDDLGRTVRSRIGYQVAKEEVLAASGHRDRWDVLGGRDLERDRLMQRRMWLRGRDSGRMALVLSFAPYGQPLDTSLVTGTTIDADLAFYPGALPLRAIVGTRHGPARSAAEPPGTGVAAMHESYAAALEHDPWLDRWPVVLGGVTPVPEDGWLLADDAGAAVPILPAGGDPWRLIAVSGGRPVTVAGEWTPSGLWPLTAWDDGRAVPL